MAESPVSRTLKALRGQGFLCDVCERRVPLTHSARDLFMAFDIAAIHKDHNGVLGVQATSLSNLAARCHKLVANPAVKVWLLAGNRVEVWGWSLRGAAGFPKRWGPTKRLIYLNLFGEVAVEPPGRETDACS